METKFEPAVLFGENGTGDLALFQWHSQYPAWSGMLEMSGEPTRVAREADSVPGSYSDIGIAA